MSFLRQLCLSPDLASEGAFSILFFFLSLGKSLSKCHSYNCKCIALFLPFSLLGRNCAGVRSSVTKTIGRHG
uniref:Uncharacterized protein n=1 Tax=Anguilla anguilla TaxID=7936 RepID=A0A0E9WST9_ANGAN